MEVPKEMVRDQEGVKSLNEIQEGLRKSTSVANRLLLVISLELFFCIMMGLVYMNLIL